MKDIVPGGGPKLPAFLTRGVALTSGNIEIDNPAGEIRAGLWTAIAFFVVFFAWAALVKVDAAIHSSGMIAVEGSRESVQNMSGGVVSAMLVKEGQIVKKGDVLVELAGGRSQADAKALRAQHINLTTQEARLMAEATGAAGFAEPEALKVYVTPEDRLQVENAMLLQRQSMASRRQFVGAQISVLHQQQNQTREAVAGNQDKLTASSKRQQLAQEELEAVQPLEAKGYAPKTKIRQLQQNIAGLEGENGALQAEISKGASQIGESRSREQTTRSQAMTQIMDELRQTQQMLGELIPKLTAAESEYAATSVRATTSGKVLGLTVFNAGSVVKPGQKILEIVPDSAPLVIEANIEAKDGDDLRAGQEAHIRITALQERDLPVMKGRVLKVSPDSFQDERTGASYYRAQIEVSAENIALVDRMRGNHAWLKPGLPVEVIIPMRKRTVLAYLFEPLTKTLWKAFREH